MFGRRILLGAIIVLCHSPKIRLNVFLMLCIKLKKGCIKITLIQPFRYIMFLDLIKQSALQSMRELHLLVPLYLSGGVHLH